MKDKRIIWKQKELINHLRGFINNEIIEEGFLLPEEHDWDEFIKIDKLLREELAALESEPEVTDEEILKTIPYKEPISKHQSDINIGWIRCMQAMRDKKIK